MTRSGKGGRRRVLVLNHFAAPRAAPGGTRHVELFGRLKEWEPTILASNRNLLTRTVTARDEGIRIVWTTPYSPGGASRILNWASYALGAFVKGIRQPTELVYASSPHLLAVLVGWALSRVKRVPLIVEVRDLWPQVLVDMGQLESSSLLFRLLKRLERFLYAQADAVVILAEGNRAAVVSDGAPPDRIIMLPNCAEPSDFNVDEDRETLRARFGMEGLVFLYAGAHGQANGLHLVLDAAEQLQVTHPDIRFWLVGDGLLKPYLAKDAARRCLHNVLFLDAVPKRQMPALLAAADVGLHVLADVPLFRNGVSPNKVFDYMAAGRPVLTNTPGEVAELIRTAGAGIDVNPSGLAEGVRTLALMDERDRIEHGRAGRRFMEAHRSRTIIAGELAAVLDQVTDLALSSFTPAKRRESLLDNKYLPANPNHQSERTDRVNTPEGAMTEFDSSLRYTDGTQEALGWFGGDREAYFKSNQVRCILGANRLVPTSICDVGCGTGGVLGEMAQWVPPTTRLIGYDIRTAISVGEINPRVELFSGDFLRTTEHYDLITLLDVFEHIGDYLGFLGHIRSRADHFIFHIPLDLSAQALLRSEPLLRARRNLGHLHYFTRETALATLRDSGYHILDERYTTPSFSLPPRHTRERLARWPRRLLFLGRPNLASRLVGGFPLLVLALADAPKHG